MKNIDYTHLETWLATVKMGGSVMGLEEIGEYVVVRLSDLEQVTTPKLKIKP